MAERQYRATLNKGRSGWCVIFRHPVCKRENGKESLRVRRGLGTKDKDEAERLVKQLNEILKDSTFWNPAAKAKAESRFDQRIVAAFYDHLVPDRRDGWVEREKVIPLPGSDEGYAKALLVGATGSGKTTLVRQVIGTDPKSERFPSTSASRTTICDLEIILAEGEYRAAVSFIPREQVRQDILECVIAAVSGHLEDSTPTEIVRRFMTHSEQRFRLNYILGSWATPRSPTQDDLHDDDDEEPADDEDSEVTDEERLAFQERICYFLREVERLSALSKGEVSAVARTLNIDLDDASHQDRDIIQELVEEKLLQEEDFHALVDEILDEVEQRFEFLGSGSLVRGKDGWPVLWTHTSDERKDFLQAVNRFSSNYAPSYGKLLTPLVEGIRVSGPFLPEWGTDVVPPLVLLDGQGIGHVADSGSSISTGITCCFPIADVILLVDDAAQPMQAAPISVLQTISTSGHEAKLIVCFTHFDEVKGDNFPDTESRKNHVISSFCNAVHAIGKASGREAEFSLKRLIPDRLVFLSDIQNRLPARFTRSELARLLDVISSSIEPPPPTHFRPVYDIANLVLAVQKATQEFHDRWKGVLGMGAYSGVRPETWQRVKALTRRIGLFRWDHYGKLMPRADLIKSLQTHVSSFLSVPLKWSPKSPPEDREAEKIQVIDSIRRQVFNRLHELSQKRLIEERLSGWAEAYGHRGAGSTRVRAREILVLYESAAPIPNEMPGPDANEFISEVRELVAKSVIDGGGKLLGWEPAAIELD